MRYLISVLFVALIVPGLAQADLPKAQARAVGNQDDLLGWSRRRTDGVAALH